MLMPTTIWNVLCLWGPKRIHRILRALKFWFQPPKPEPHGTDAECENIVELIPIVCLMSLSGLWECGEFPRATSVITVCKWLLTKFALYAMVGLMLLPHQPFHHPLHPHLGETLSPCSYVQCVWCVVTRTVVTSFSSGWTNPMGPGILAKRPLCLWMLFLKSVLTPATHTPAFFKMIHSARVATMTDDFKTRSVGLFGQVTVVTVDRLFCLLGISPHGIRHHQSNQTIGTIVCDTVWSQPKTFGWLGQLGHLWAF